MTLPATPSVTIRFGPGAGFGPVMVLGTGVLGTAILGTAATEFVNLTSVQRITIQRGRDKELDSYNAGTATIQFLDTGGLWNPTYTASPYGAKVKPFNQVQIAVTYASVNYKLFTGYVQSWDYEWQPGTGTSLVTIQAVDAFRLLSLANLTTVSGATAGETTGSRIGNILSQVSWPTTYRAIDAGEITVQADPGTSRTALAACQAMEEAELGALFVDGSGNITFYSRGRQSQLASTAIGLIPQFSNTVGANASYEQIDVAYDDTDLANQVSVTRSGGTTQTVFDSTSISDYYLRTMARTGGLMQTDTQALGQANLILNYRKTIRQRCNSITVNLAKNAYTATKVLDLELCDPIYVNYQPIAGPDIQFRATVQGIRHEITPANWSSTISTAYPLATAFILGSDEFGKLGTSTL